MVKRNAGESEHGNGIPPNGLFRTLPYPGQLESIPTCSDKLSFIFGGDRFKELHDDTNRIKNGQTFDLAKLDDTKMGIKWPSNCHICFKIIRTSKYKSHCINRINHKNGDDI